MKSSRGRPWAVTMAAMVATVSEHSQRFRREPQYVRVTYRGEIEEVMLINAGGVELERAKVSEVTRRSLSFVCTWHAFPERDSIFVFFLLHLLCV